MTSWSPLAVPENVPPPPPPGAPGQRRRRGNWPRRWASCTSVLLAVLLSGCSYLGLKRPTSSFASPPFAQAAPSAEPTNSVSVAQWARQISKTGSDLPPEKSNQLAQQITSYLPAEKIDWNRRELVTALGTLNSPQALVGLENALVDPSREVRTAACLGLGRQKHQRAIELLGHTLVTDNDLDVRLAATRALGEHRRPEAVLALAPALDDPDPALRYCAIQSLEANTDRDFGGDIAAWKKYAAQLMLESDMPQTMLAQQAQDTTASSGLANEPTDPAAPQTAASDASTSDARAPWMR